MILRIASLALAFIALPLDASQADQVQGTATDLQRMALPPHAVLDAQGEDVSRADAPAKTIGSVRIIGPGNPPIAFMIEVDPQRIDVRHRYSVRATITVDEKLLFTTDQLYPVLTQGNGRDVELLLRQTGCARRKHSDYRSQQRGSHATARPPAECIPLFQPHIFTPFIRTRFVSRAATRSPLITPFAMNGAQRV